MNSCLYECQVMHHRLSPRQHKFVHSTFMFYLDLDEMDGPLGRLRLFGRNRPNLFNFCDRDHMDFGAATIKENILRYLKMNGVDLPGGRIMLLTNVRVLGYIFNPVSFYFCFDRDGRPVCVVPEIGNTFLERKPYFIGPDDFKDGRFRVQRIKYFYISPFVDLDVTMDFQLRIPDADLDISIDDMQSGKKFLFSSLTGKRAALTDQNLFKYAFKIPFVTLKVISLIHWHAFLLWLKKIPHHKKEDNLDQQKEVQNVFYHHPAKKSGHKF